MKHEHWADRVLFWIMDRVMFWPADVVRGRHAILRIVGMFMMGPWAISVMVVSLPVLCVCVFGAMFRELGKPS